MTVQSCKAWPKPTPQLWKTHLGVSEPNSCTQRANGTYIRSSDPKGFFPSFKTLDLAAGQSSAAKSIDAPKL